MDILQIITDPLTKKIGNKILSYLDVPRDVATLRTTCKAWQKLIDSSPKYWIQKYELWRNPLWREIHAEIPMEQYNKLGHLLMKYKEEEEDFTGSKLNPNERDLIPIVYGNLDRLQFFWPFLKKHPLVVLNFVTCYGLIDILRFLLQNLENLETYLTLWIPEFSTPLHEAAYHGDLEMIRLLFSYYKVLPINQQAKCPIDCALENGHFEIARFLKAWFNSDRSDYSASQIKKSLISVN